MRRIERPSRFKRDYKRKPKGHTAPRCKLTSGWPLTALAHDEPLAERYRDHTLTSVWSDHRDCHIKPDLILIYRKPDAETLQLVRLGSHSELGL